MKKSTLLMVFVILSTMYLMTSCESEKSEDVNQDRIHCIYELNYNANEDVTYARASFKFGNALGTTLELTYPSEIRFNNELLTFKSALGYYEKNFAGYVENGTFKWKDTEGNEFVNSISITSINFPANIDTIHRNAAYELIWVGDSLSANQSVILTANGVLENDVQIFTQSNINSKSIILPLNQLQQLGQGQGTLWMDRIYSPILQQKTSAGGSITAKYRPINKQVIFD